jgi:hypothetical protein
VKAQAYPGPGRQNMLVSASINRSTMSRCRTCLVYHIDKRLRVFPNEAADCVTRIGTRENGLDQGGELMLGERACDQTSTGWELELRKEENQGQSAFHARRQSGAKGVPLSDTEVVAVSTGLKLLFWCGFIRGSGAGSGLFAFVATASELDVLLARPSCARFTAILRSFDRTTEASSSRGSSASAASRFRKRSWQSPCQFKTTTINRDRGAYLFLRASRVAKHHRDGVLGIPRVRFRTAV